MSDFRKACDIRKGFAGHFRAWRKAHQIQLKQLAPMLGVSQATLSSWETGTRFPSAGHLIKLVERLGIPPCRLFCVCADIDATPACGRTRKP